MAHRFMVLRAPANGDFYPSQAAGIGASTVYSTGTVGSSDFADTDTDAIIYSIHVDTGATAVTVGVADSAGSEWLQLEITNGQQPSSKDFGPLGVRMDSGFRVNITNGGTATVTITYDKVAKL
jgi:hypothetical protein